MRDYIEQLRKRGELRVVRREVDPAFELAGVIVRSQRESDAAILFEKVKGTRFPVVSNVFGSQRRLSEMIGATDGFCRRWLEVVSKGVSFPAAGRPITAVPGDLQEGRMRDLPHIRYFERDAGPYLTAGVFLAKEPDTGVPNLSFSRSMMVSDTELRVRLAPPHDLTKYQAKAEQRGAPLDVAILLGPPPEVFLAACASVPYEADEMAIAAQLRGAPLPLRPCKTIDLMVPAETEIVIEGRILPNERRPEGPFGEFLGYYVGEGRNHVFEVQHVSWRRDAMFHALLCGYAEDLRALEISFASRVYRHIVADLPGILDVSCSPSPLHTIVKIRPQFEGHAQQVILKTFSSHLQYNKVVIVVDEDVDIHDFQDVWWAVMTRCRVDRKITIIPDIPGFYRDEARVHWGRLGIDATKPFGREKEFERKVIPGAAELNLRDYF
jgi:4-hydroxybenzoate decarboxylase